MIVRDVMSSDPFVAHVTTTVRQVLRTMNEANIRHMPIVEGHALIGIVSERDLRSLAPGTFDEIDRPEEVSRFMAQPISKFMNTAVLSVEPEDELRDVVDLMLENKIGAVPVVEPDSLKLVGIVSYVDVLAAVRDDL